MVDIFKISKPKHMKASDKLKVRIAQSLLFFIILAINLTMCQKTEAQKNCNNLTNSTTYTYINVSERL